jgi:hypothetical protein
VEQGGGGWLDAIGSFITKNPQLISGLAGAGASIYGAHRMGSARDREVAAQVEAEQARLEQRKKEHEDALAREEKEREMQRVAMIINAISRTMPGLAGF